MKVRKLLATFGMVFFLTATVNGFTGSMDSGLGEDAWPFRSPRHVVLNLEDPREDEENPPSAARRKECSDGVFCCAVAAPLGGIVLTAAGIGIYYAAYFLVRLFQLAANP